MDAILIEKQFEEARAYVKQNLADIAEELVNWHRDDFLADDAKFRKAAALCPSFPGSNKMAIAEKIVSDEALLFVITMSL